MAVLCLSLTLTLDFFALFYFLQLWGAFVFGQGPMDLRLVSCTAGNPSNPFASLSQEYPGSFFGPFL